METKAEAESGSSTAESSMTSSERGYALWRGPLKSAKLVVAPMVDASELPWRMLSRRYGAELCYTPMLHSTVFVKDQRYQRESLVTCSEDRPLIVQFCANDPDVFVAACRLAAPHCDAVDLNLGCPQAIARRGHYGSFLQDEWNLIAQMISRASRETGVPITAKIRVFPEVSKTVEYARMLESAGACILTVHGRTRDQKGPMTGLANWGLIKAVKEAVKVPVFANGNIQFSDDVERCLLETGVEGVMTAEGNLHNPAIFSGKQFTVWDMVFEYLDLVKKYPCPLSYTRGHVFKVLHHCLSISENFDLRFQLSKASNIESMIEITELLKERYVRFHNHQDIWTSDQDSDISRLPEPPWICQPYVRIPPEEHLQKMADGQMKAKEEKRIQNEDISKRFISEDDQDVRLSKKKQKKLQKNPAKKFLPLRDSYDKCICRNPRGGRCTFNLCRACCKIKCFSEELDCVGHKILAKTRKEKSNEENQAKVNSLLFHEKNILDKNNKEIDQGNNINYSTDLNINLNCCTNQTNYINVKMKNDQIEDNL